MDKEQILALADRLDAVREGMEAGIDDWPTASQIWEYQQASKALRNLIAESDAAIESYKDELLKEVGDPIAYYDPDLDCGSAGISFDPLSDGIYLYTSNQVAAVILKVTKQMKEEVARYRGKSIADADRTEAYLYENQELRAQLATAQEEIANETTEAIAKMLESGSFLSTESKVALAANGAAKAIRRGAWKEFKK